MNTKFFLGANSGDGFYSLYDGFSRSEGDFLYLIKGGPGCGKSSFMRKIGAEAEKKGLSVEYILCSGDPDSLDGIYIKELKTGFCDATAPHISEPRVFGYDSCYVNLGQFCRRLEGKAAAELNAKYKQMYRAAYSYLSAAASLKREEIPYLLSLKETETAERRARSAVKRHSGIPSGSTVGTKTLRFIRCISCKGQMCLDSTVMTLCKQIYLLDDLCGAAQYYLNAAANEALIGGHDIILCPSPLCPEIPDAVIIPDCGLGFVSASAMTVTGAYRHVRLDALIPSERLSLYRAELKRREKLCSSLIDCAVSYLGKAKLYHDELELEYKEYINFDALNEYTGKFISELFE